MRLDGKPDARRHPGMGMAISRFALAATACWALGATASAAPGAADVPLPPALANIVGVGGHVTYLGMVDGLEGYLVTGTRADGSVLALPAYVTPGGNHIILGHAHDATGVDITDLQKTRLKLRLEEAKALVTPSPPLDFGSAPERAIAVRRGPTTAALQSAAAFAEQVKTGTASFHVGRPGAPLAYLVTDQDCADCERTADLLRPMAAAGTIDLVVVATAPNAQSEEAAIGLLSQPKVALAWYSKAAPTRSPPPEVKASLRAWIASNNAFAKGIGAGPAPILAYVGADGNWIVRQGVPAEAPALAAASDAKGDTR